MIEEEEEESQYELERGAARVNEMIEDYENSLVGVQNTVNYQPDRTTSRTWEIIRDECIGKNSLDDRCNVIAASNGTGKLEVIRKILSCGCIMYPSGTEEVIL